MGSVPGVTWWLAATALAGASAVSVHVQEKSGAPSVFRGLPGVCGLQPHPEAPLRRASVDVGFILWKSSLGKREGEARGQALRAPSTSRNLGPGG